MMFLDYAFVLYYYNNNNNCYYNFNFMKRNHK